MIAIAVFVCCAGAVAWVYAGYPAFVALVAKVRPRPRQRRLVVVPVSVIVAAHDEEAAIGSKLDNIRASDYPPSAVEIVVASDGSVDRTCDVALAHGADHVLDLPRVGKARALNAAAEIASGEILVFTDADSLLEPRALPELVAAFADPDVGGASATEVRALPANGAAVARGEGLYWRYEHWLKRLEDRIGSTVSACGGLYAIRRSLIRRLDVLDGSDDFLISSAVVAAGRRLAFEERSRIALELPREGRREFARKVRVMNQGLRAAFSLGPLLLPWRGGLYGVQVVSHKILRRFVPFFLVGLFVSTAWLAPRGWGWTALLAFQCALYTLAAVGFAGRKRAWGRRRVFWVPYYFCLANAAAAAAVASIVAGVRYTEWEPDRESAEGDVRGDRVRAGAASRERS
jgi:cellulose synthase/poly-beta-1,6-N-acetylglucosamine synthase-like glycosyltransferase